MMRTSSTKDIKKANRNALYNAIYQNTGISRPELAVKVKASLPTVIHNIKSLLDDNLICESGSLESTGGRKAATLAIVANARTAVGVDIALDRVVSTMVNLEGNIISHKQKRVRFSPEPAYIDMLGQEIEKLIDESGQTKQNILGIGISIPGIMSADAAEVSSHALSLDSYPLKPIEDRMGMHCVFENDANAASIAEAWAYPGKRTFIYLSLKDAVGGALVWHGNPLPGDNGRCGEFGHMTVEHGGLQCYCGKKGCLDSYCSALNLSEKAGGSLTGFFEKLQEGDPRTRLIWDNYLDYLATSINILRMALDYDVVIGGHVGAFMDKHIDELRRRVAELDTFDTTGSYIEPCRYKVEASAVGAALIHVSRFITSI
ncbi:MAG: ROK family transcriptional regulator [Planctomycetaceae bacterium]|nr:ROK family transcriptional regulator [Planctomycetaceae bacterium]